jgi:hypothetical protein
MVSVIFLFWLGKLIERKDRWDLLEFEGIVLVVVACSDFLFEIKDFKYRNKS